ncbi:class I SAM-dependent methyltransferase [Thermodesulforhabdus norvegica]|uniref:S-adenosyl-L-methionine-dependent methyltransferase n=1 Tax=Thermodesulforhabdus norvegica TaxID=39841 RepID=A0A1I4UQW5_9BACT|nr:class I SAM-dependent methyltransferase [Thermodesulforhabdus norvegica]SFM91305.1 methyltransferase, TIGR00027 family [Thermodesulforhabdus norvegica]
MHDGKGSRTSERAAVLRALHQVIDRPRVFDDPLALRIIGAERAREILQDPSGPEQNPWSPYLRAFLVARSRYAEDALAEAVARGVGQCVILGAGLDTFAFRQRYGKDRLRIYEVDHPDSQNLKRQRLRAAGIPIPENVVFVSIDLEVGQLEEALRDVGYDPERPGFFSWLGVTEYLTVDVVLSTLAFIASGPVGTTVVFDYLLPPSLLHGVQRRTFDALAYRVEAAGEPWRTFFEPEELARQLANMGFKSIVDVGPEALNEMYFQDREDGLMVRGFSRIAQARV